MLIFSHQVTHNKVDHEIFFFIINHHLLNHNTPKFTRHIPTATGNRCTAQCKHKSMPSIAHLLWKLILNQWFDEGNSLEKPHISQSFIDGSPATGTWESGLTLSLLWNWDIILFENVKRTWNGFLLCMCVLYIQASHK